MMKKLSVFLVQFAIACGAAAHDRDGVGDPSCAPEANAAFWPSHPRLEREFFKVLMKGYSDPKTTFLEGMVLDGDVVIVKKALAYGAKDPDGLALLAAINANRDDILDALLESHEVKDPKLSALRVALSEKKCDAAKKLLDNAKLGYNPFKLYSMLSGYQGNCP